MLEQIGQGSCGVSILGKNQLLTWRTWRREPMGMAGGSTRTFQSLKGLQGSWRAILAEGPECQDTGKGSLPASLGAGRGPGDAGQ